MSAQRLFLLLVSNLRYISANPDGSVEYLSWGGQDSLNERNKGNDVEYSALKAASQ